MQNNNLIYDVLGFDGKVIDRLDLRVTLDGRWGAKTSSSGSTSNGTIRYSGTNNGKDMVVKHVRDKPIVIGPDRADDQAGVLNNLCYGTLKDVDCASRSPGTCGWRRPTPTVDPRRAAGDPSPPH